MAEFLAMGGYAEYVWSAYGLALATLIFNVISARRRMRFVTEKVMLNAARQANRARRRQTEARGST
jgi:heme exporter protein D